MTSKVGGGKTFEPRELFPRRIEVHQEVEEQDNLLLSEQLKLLFTRIDEREKMKAA